MFLLAVEPLTEQQRHITYGQCWPFRSTTTARVDGFGAATLNQRRQGHRAAHGSLLSLLACHSTAIPQRWPAKQHSRQRSTLVVIGANGAGNMAMAIVMAGRHGVAAVCGYGASLQELAALQLLSTPRAAAN